MDTYTVEIYYNGTRERCRAFYSDADREVAVWICKKLVCRDYGITPDSEEGARFMELLSASVDRPEAVAAVIASVEERG